MKNFGLDTKISGKSTHEFIAGLLERNEKLELEIERGKLSIGLLKQLNNTSRLELDAAKYEQKKREFDLKLQQ